MWFITSTFTGKKLKVQQNASQFGNPPLLFPTLYASPLITLTAKGYTKHYFEEGRRVCSKIGGGLDVIGNDEELQTKADMLFEQSLEQVNSRVLHENNLDCIMNNEFAKEEFGYWIDDIPYQMKADVECDYKKFKEMVHSMLDDLNHGEEKEVYFYHSDHLGSASWITDSIGIPIQHLQYLPYGEPYIDQRAAGTTYSERFRFTGKERDAETGYGYFGARYMDHELMTMWLSVDPMADKYPSISPYAYCVWNPVSLVDSDGRDVYRLDVSDGSLKLYQKTKDNTDKIIAGTYEGIGRAKTFKEAGKSIVFSKGVLNGKKGEDLSVTGFSTYGNNQADGLKVAQFISFQCKKELCGVGFTSAFFTDELDVFGWTENDAYNSNWTMGDLSRTSDEKKLQYFFHTHPNDKNGRGGKGIPSLADTRAAHQLQSVYGISNNYIISQKDGTVGYCEKGIFLGLHTINKR